jgi:hypothetical protein
MAIRTRVDSPLLVSRPLFARPEPGKKTAKVSENRQMKNMQIGYTNQVKTTICNKSFVFSLLISCARVMFTDHLVWLFRRQSPSLHKDVGARSTAVYNAFLPSDCQQRQGLESTISPPPTHPVTYVYKFLKLLAQCDIIQTGFDKILTVF